MSMTIKLLIASAAATVLVYAGCTDSETAPVAQPAGAAKTVKTKALETGAAALQKNAPVEQLSVYLSGLHVMKGDSRHQMIAHHFCRQVTEELAQCALFDGNDANANLIGVEYIISEKLFDSLPREEQQYWHPHNYEILSGQLVGPWLPDDAEKELMRGKLNSYGKTWHLWNTGFFLSPSGDKVPLGLPALAWSFNRDGEATAGLVEKRDELQKVSTEEKRRQRADMSRLAHPQRGVEAMKEVFPVAKEYMPGVREKR